MKKLFSKILIFAFLLSLSSVSFALESDTANLQALDESTQSLDDSIREAIQNKSDDTDSESLNKTIETRRPIVKDLDEMRPNANDEITDKVLADTEDNIKSTVKKFAFAMIGVIVSSIVIFVILLFMRRMNGMAPNEENHSVENKNRRFKEYQQGTNEEESLRIFFEKTSN